MTQIIKLPIDELDVQLVGETVTTPVTVKFVRKHILEIDLPCIDENRYFNVQFMLIDTRLVMVIRDYHGNLQETGEKPRVEVIHNWNEATQ